MSLASDVRSIAREAVANARAFAEKAEAGDTHAIYGARGAMYDGERKIRELLEASKQEKKKERRPIGLVSLADQFPEWAADWREADDVGREILQAGKDSLADVHDKHVMPYQRGCWV